MGKVFLAISDELSSVQVLPCGLGKLGCVDGGPGSESQQGITVL